MGASAEERPATLAIVYDELLRKEIENKCGQLGAQFKFQEMLVRLDERTLRGQPKSWCRSSRQRCSPICLNMSLCFEPHLVLCAEKRVGVGPRPGAEHR